MGGFYKSLKQGKTLPITYCKVETATMIFYANIFVSLNFFWPEYFYSHLEPLNIALQLHRLFIRNKTHGARVFLDYVLIPLCKALMNRDFIEKIHRIG